MHLKSPDSHSFLAHNMLYFILVFGEILLAVEVTELFSEQCLVDLSLDPCFSPALKGEEKRKNLKSETKKYEAYVLTLPAELIA